MATLSFTSQQAMNTTATIGAAQPVDQSRDSKNGGGAVQPAAAFSDDEGLASFTNITETECDTDDQTTGRHPSGTTCHPRSTQDTWIRSLPAHLVTQNKPLKRLHSVINLLEMPSTRKQREHVQLLLQTWGVPQKVNGKNVVSTKSKQI